MFARSDVMALSLGEHGCGAAHTRPVTHGAPAKVFQLDCPPCESYLRGDRRHKKLVYEKDSKTGQILRQARVADSDPMWSSTPDSVPLTPDETRTNEVRSERGRMQIEMLQALAALRSTGVEVPPEAMWLLERELPAGVLKGTIVCASGHDVPAGTKFCPECGTSMAARGAITPPGEPAPGPEIDLERVHPQTLKKNVPGGWPPGQGQQGRAHRPPPGRRLGACEPGGRTVPPLRRAETWPCRPRLIPRRPVRPLRGRGVREARGLDRRRVDLLEVLKAEEGTEVRGVTPDPLSES